MPVDPQGVGLGESYALGLVDAFLSFDVIDHLIDLLKSLKGLVGFDEGLHKVSALRKALHVIRILRDDLLPGLDLVCG
jgi:hypothetical protein